MEGSHLLADEVRVMMKSVYIETGAKDAEAFALFDGIAAITFGEAGDDHEARAIERGANALIVTGRWLMTGALFDRIPTLEVVARPGVGYDNVDLDAATERGVVAVNVPGGPTESTAEHAVMLMLAAANRLRYAEKAAREAQFKWMPETKGIEVAGKTLGLIGLGRIGGRVAQICSRGLRMNVLAYDPYASPDHALDVGATLESDLDKMLSKVDFLSFHAPPTPETRKIINARTLALMKPAAYLINCARGALVDEAALVEALRSGSLAGAALDVYDPEPPNGDNPLFEMDNVILTPHNAAFTDDAVKAMLMGCAEQIVDVFQGRMPPHVLNPEVWDNPRRRSRSSV